VKIIQIEAASVPGTLLSLHTTQAYTCTQIHLYSSNVIDPFVVQLNLTN